MTTFTFNTELKGFAKKDALVEFVHSMDMSVEEFATGKENELLVNGKLLQFCTVFNDANFEDTSRVVSLEKSVSQW